jgi:hypothetical protein
MKRLSLLSLILVLVVHAQLANAQTSTRESRITITSQSPILNFRTSNNGDSFSVVVVAPVAPSTESDLSAGGFNDLQVSQEGGNLVVSFRLLKGATARVVHNSSRLEIVVRVADPPRAGVSRGRGAVSDGQTQANTVPPNRTANRTANSDAEPGETANSLVQPAGNDGTPAIVSAPALSRGRSPVAAPPAPQATGDAPKQNLSVLGNVDLAVPESPAFTILGVTPQTVVRPASPKEFATSFLNGVDDHGNFQSGLALDAVPYLIFAGDGITLYDYNRNYLTRLLSRTQLSLATTKGTGANDKSTRLGLGLHMTLWDKGDPRADQVLFQCYDRVDQNIQAAVLKFLTDTPGGVKNPAFPAFLATQKAAYTTATNKCDELARKRNWKQSGFVIGAAPSWISNTGTTDKFRWNGGGFWTSLAYGFEGVKGLDDKSQLILHLRVRSNEQVADPANAGKFLLQNSRFFGARFNVGNANNHLSFEGVYLWLKRPGLAPDNSYRYSLGVERRVAENTWFQLSLGGDSGRRDGNNQAFIKGTLNWGFTRKQEREAPAVLAQQ